MGDRDILDNRDSDGSDPTSIAARLQGTANITGTASKRLDAIRAAFSPPPDTDKPPIAAQLDAITAQVNLITASVADLNARLGRSG